MKIMMMIIVMTNNLRRSQRPCVKFRNKLLYTVRIVIQ
jgi:hypothetical protein